MRFDFLVHVGRCESCGVTQRVASMDGDEGQVTLCGECLARVLEGITGWKMVAMYKTMAVQSSLKVQNPKEHREIPLRRRRKS